MEEFSLRNLVNKHIDDEKKRNDKMRSKSAIYKWINGDVNDEIIAINDEFKRILNKGDKNERKIFADSINTQFKTDSFINFLLNTSKPTEDYYKKLLKKCIIHNETIDNFFKPEGNSNPKTLDFFNAFCKNQEREYEGGISNGITQPQKKQTPNAIKTETLEISGATIINEVFINDIKNREFSMAEFYTAKQNKDCQWYGILHNFDIIRKDYYKIKDIVIKSFNGQNSGISSIIYGSGGCGKSTLLRRLAIELSQNETQKPLQEQIKIVWLNDNGFENFYNSGLHIIEQNYGSQFLVIIEDWYRITEHDKEIAYKFLKKTDSITNIRVVIGDRIVEKKCKDLLDSEPILLSPDENESIIALIIENNREWKEIADKLFKDENNYQCSLFLLLFIIAYASQNKNTQLNFVKPKKAFVEIIEKDLKIIEKEYKGLAKALYYWACIYEKHRIFISYGTFLAIADHYNENKLISKYFSRWNMEDPILDKLKMYVNINYSLGKNSDKNIIQFNQDILADEGLSKIDWGFKDTVKVDLLEVITDFGDDTSASSFLKIMILNEEQIFNDRDEKLLFIDRLIEKKNQNPIYANAITKLKLNDSEIKNYAHKLFAIENYDHVFWSYYLNRIKDDIVINEGFKNLLINSKLTDYNPTFIKILLIKFRYDKLVQKISKEILKDDWRKNSLKIISTCLNITKSQKLRQNISNKVLNDEGWKKNYLIINYCLHHSYGKIKLSFSNNVLNDENWKDIDYDIVCKCMDYADEGIRRNFLYKILKDESWKKSPDKVICNSLKYVNEEIKQNFSNKVLNDESWNKTSHQIINKCLHYSNEEIKRSFSNKVLNDENSRNTPTEIIFNSLKYADEEIKQNFSNKILSDKNSRNTPTQIIFNSLKYADEEIKRNFSNRVLNDESWNKTSHALINKCLHYSNEEIKRSFSNKVLNDENWRYTPTEIICNSLKYADEEIKKRFSNKVLNGENWINIHAEIICSCIKNSRNNEFPLLVLKDWNKYDWRIIYNSLLFFEKEKDFLFEVNDVIKEVINNYHKPKRNFKKSYFNYADILRIDLKNYPLWQKEVTYIINNWDKNKRKLITNVLYSNRDNPKIVISTCRNILLNWRFEIYKSIVMENYQKTHYGDHVKIALGHPKLRLQSKKTATEIINSIQQENFKVPEYIKEIAIKITENNIYPEWKL